MLHSPTILGLIVGYEVQLIPCKQVVFKANLVNAACHIDGMQHLTEHPTSMSGIQQN